jgi:hypothetical protein
MSAVSFGGLLIISLIAVAAPILAASVKRLKLPSAVVEIVAGIIVGPSVLAWVKIDQPVNVVALLGLAFLLFLAGLEIDLRPTTPSQFRAPLAGVCRLAHARGRRGRRLPCRGMGPRSVLPGHHAGSHAARARRPRPHRRGPIGNCAGPDDNRRCDRRRVWCDHLAYAFLFSNQGRSWFRRCARWPGGFSGRSMLRGLTSGRLARGGGRL